MNLKMLGIGRKTLYRKIGAHNRTQAAMIAKEEGLI